MGSGIRPFNANAAAELEHRVPEEAEREEQRSQPGQFCNDLWHVIFRNTVSKELSREVYFGDTTRRIVFFQHRAKI